MKKIIIGIVSLLLIVSGGILFIQFNDDSKTNTIDTDSDVTDKDDKPIIIVDDIDALIDSMTLEEKIGQMFFVRPEGLDGGKSTENNATKSINNKEIDTLKKYHVGGVIFFSNNLNTKDDLIKYIDDLQDNSKYKLFIGVDEEGGIVSRLGARGDMGVTYFPSMRELGNTNDPKKAFNVGDTLGRELKDLGFNLDFAPVADINTNPNNPVIGNRSFGTTKEAVSPMVVEEVKGLQDRGVSASLKHFPGHGDTSTDSHTGIAVIDADKKRLESIELVPFKEGIKAGADFVLTAHISIPKVIGDDTPATMSKVIITDILRKELAFEKIVITDALEMGAITNYYTTEEIVLNSINAGIDVLLMPINFEEAYTVLLNAVKDGKISEDRINQSVKRIMSVKIDREIIK